MKIAVWSRTDIKIDAVRAALSHYPDYRDAHIEWIATDSGVSAQPIGMDETITGACNRAKNAHALLGADRGIGLEGGLFIVPQAKTGYLNVAVCAIYDGESFHIGFSTGFEYPRALIEKVMSEWKEISKAAVEIGLISPDDPWKGQEIVGALTKGIVTRQQELEWAIHMAMIHLNNPGY